MKRFILPLYILREHVGPFLFSFSVITLIFMLNLLFRELNRILSKGLPFGVVTEFLVLNLAWIVAVAVPMAVLSASVMAFGRLSADHEVIAMRASGLSHIHLILPCLIAAGLIAGGLIWFNNNVLPECNHRVRQLAIAIAQKRPSVVLEPGVWSRAIPQMAMLAGSVREDKGLTRVTDLLIDDQSDPEQRRTISARTAYFIADPEGGLYHFTLFDGEMQEVKQSSLDSFQRVRFKKHVLTAEAEGAFLRRDPAIGRDDREKSTEQMHYERREDQARRHQLGRMVNDAVAEEFVRVTGETFGLALADQIEAGKKKRGLDGNALTAVPLDRLRDAVMDSGKEIQKTDGIQSVSLPVIAAIMHREQHLLETVSRHRQKMVASRKNSTMLQVEVNKKFAIPTACLVFVLVGAPLGMVMRKGSFAASSGLSLAFFLLYWVFLIAGEDLADREIISPFVAMWSPNLILGGAALLLIVRNVGGATLIERLTARLHEPAGEVEPRKLSAARPVPALAATNPPNTDPDRWLLEELVLSTRCDIVMVCDRNGSVLLQAHKPEVELPCEFYRLLPLVIGQFRSSHAVAHAMEDHGGPPLSVLAGHRWNVLASAIDWNRLLVLLTQAEMPVELASTFARRIAGLLR